MPALLHQLSRTCSPIHTEDFRSSAAPTVLQFTPKTFVPTLLQKLSRTGSPIHTEDFRSGAAPPTVKDRISHSHRKLSSLFQFTPRCSTDCQGQVLQFTPKTFVPALLHQLSRTGSPIHTEDFSFQRCSTNCQGQVLQFSLQRCSTNCQNWFSNSQNFRSSAAPPTVKDRFSNSHRRLCRSSAAPPTVKEQDLQFTPKTFVPALLHQLSKDRISNSHRRLSLQRCSTNCQGQDLQFTPKTFVLALLHQLSRTDCPIHTEDFRCAAPPTVKDRISNSHRRLSFCAAPPFKDTPIHTQEDFRSNAAPEFVKDRISNSHRRLSFQRCSTNC